MAKAPLSIFLVAIFFFFLFLSSSEALMEETQALLQFKKELKDPLNFLENWKISESPCDFYGISCDSISGLVTNITLNYKSLSGEISPAIFVLRNLSWLDLSSNSLSGNLPFQLVHCNNLQVLNLTVNNLGGKLPDLSALKNLQVLDVSFNKLFGGFPTWVTNLTGLISLGLGQNEFDESDIPVSIGNLKNLTWLYLANCNLKGEIPRSIYELKALQTLDISDNQLSGKFPKEISKLQNLNQIELFKNKLTGEIPSDIANLTLLSQFDISNNQMSGKLPAEMGNLKNLVVFQVFNNYFSGELPEGFGDLRHLDGFSIYGNNFSGDFPKNFGLFSPLNSFDISENKFSGGFPRFLCENKKLQFLLAVDNNFSGDLPDSYAECKSLERLRVSKNNLSGRIPSGLWGLPHAKYLDFGNNGFTGEISADLGISTSLSQLILQNNKFSGEIPQELGKLTQLEKVFANNNTFSGKIPSQIGNLEQLSSLHLENNILTGSLPPELGKCTRLVDLNLAENCLSGSIPKTFSMLNLLNSLNLSQNNLSGSILENLQKLKLSSIDFSRNQLSGKVPPDLLVIGGDHAFSGNKELCIDRKFAHQRTSEMILCSGSTGRKMINQNKLALLCIISLVLVVLLVGLLLISYRNYNLYEHGMDINLGKEEERNLNWKFESFHPREFDVEELCNLEENNLIGSGGSGKVYRLELKRNGGTVAVKQLWKGKEVKVVTAEMGILGKIRHRNILKLYACLMKQGTHFLVFEYMANGNLFHALHHQMRDGQPELNWIRRYKIAIGTAKGIAYLHHDCSPAIIHRDIKSANILLDEDYEPKIADFGIAKIAEESQMWSDSSCFAGTHGYIAPELAYSLKVTEKSDVYSFGVVLLELVTGRAPIDPVYGEGKDIVNWVSAHLDGQTDVTEVLDSGVSSYAEDDMIKVLKLALLCTTKLPSLRPTMRDVVKMLLDADPGTISPLDKNPHKY